MVNLKKISGIFLRISISIVLLLVLFKQVDRESLFKIMGAANKPLLLLAFLVLFCNYVLCLFRWEMLLRALKIHLPLKRVIISFAGGHFFNLFLPSTIGGDMMRSIDLVMHTRRPQEVIATVFLDRLSGYIGLVLLAIISLSIGYKYIRDALVLYSVLIITILLIAILFVLFNSKVYLKINRFLHVPEAGKIRELIKNLHQEIHYIKHHEEVVVVNIIFSIIVQAILPLTFFVISLSLGIKLNIIYFFIFLPIIGVITLLPISIGGLGLRDASIVFFFAKAGLEQNQAFAMSLLFFTFLLTYGAIGGLIYVLTIRHRRVQHHKAPAI